MFISSKRLREIESRLEKLEKENVIQEYFTGEYKNVDFHGWTRSIELVGSVSIKECLKELMKHLNINLTAKVIPKHKELKIVKTNRTKKL